VYPNGEAADDAGNISPFLYVTNAEGTTFKVGFKFGLVNNNDETIQYLREVLTRNGRELKSGFGFAQLLSHAELFDASKHYVVDGKLTIACKVG